MMRRVTTEDVTGLSFDGHPAEVEIGSFGARPVSDLAPDAIPREILNDIARAIVDRGFRHGVRTCEVQLTRSYRTVNGRRVGATRMVGRLTYG